MKDTKHKNILKIVRKRTKSKKENPKIAVAKRDYPPRIPEGEYDAFCYDFETGRSWGGRLDIYIKFKLIDLNYDGIELFMVCTYQKKKISRRMKYYNQWVIVTGRLPSKQEQLNPEVFLNKMYVIKVRDTIPKYDDNSPKPDIFIYSVVDRIVRVQGGKSE